MPSRAEGDGPCHVEERNPEATSLGQRAAGSTRRGSFKGRPRCGLARDHTFPLLSGNPLRAWHAPSPGRRCRGPW